MQMNYELKEIKLTFTCKLASFEADIIVQRTEQIFQAMKQSLDEEIIGIAVSAEEQIVLSEIK
jgi:hypothetical protein